MKRTWPYALGAVLLSALFAVVAAGGYLYWASHQRVVSGSESFVVHKGQGVRQVAVQLVEANILDEPYTFTIWAYLNDYTTHIYAGEYAIPPELTVAELLRLFVSGKVIHRSITFIEGWTFQEFRNALYRLDKLHIETRGLSDKQIMARLGEPGMDPEGLFFPSTYRYTAAMSDLDILRRARTAMRRVLEEEWEHRDRPIGLDNKYEALVLASIIEKETGVPEERAIISAVFHNRLRKGIRLQADPTVIYGLGEDFNGDLTSADLHTDTRYNTYTRAGLPPTPIAMPGRASIHAALHPAPSDAFYFVARGDGTHVFSETLAEHNRNVAKYQLGGGE